MFKETHIYSFLEEYQGFHRQHAESFSKALCNYISLIIQNSLKLLNSSSKYIGRGIHLL